MIYRSTDQEQEKMKVAGPPRCPVVHGELPSGPRRITQRSTANSITKQSAAAPAAAKWRGRWGNGRKDQEIFHGRPNQHQLE